MHQIIAMELSNITTAIIDNVKRLKEKHLNEIAKLTKESKLKLQRSVQSLQERLNYLQYWKEKLFINMSNETTLKTNDVVSYIKMKRIYEDIKKIRLFKVRDLHSN